ncbi:hypothetical protein FB45DRAFT_861167 [Roridomyces roridus]|uniref:N-acetyltransferase domain-containing protein n=1 Tax=Roridomyces roridus TaxID=1738132 RepID=A0AAD7FXE0_9AGAR|nr:hypothetical protein FB45DRAFT_861167 [Roridomyces roridus]
MGDSGQRNPDIDMTDELGALFTAGAKEFPSLVHGWNLERALLGHKSMVVTAVKSDPTRCLGAVVLTGDYRNRGRAGGAIQSIIEATGFGKVTVWAALPETNIDIPGKPLGPPLVNIIASVTPEFKKAALAKGVLHGNYDEELYTFYFIDLAFTQPPFLVLTYQNISDTADADDVKKALLSALVTDPFVLELAKADHSYMPNETKCEVLFKAITEHTNFRRLTSSMGGTRCSIWAITCPPLSTKPEQTVALRRHLMDPGFTLQVGFHGTGNHGATTRVNSCHAPNAIVSTTTGMNVPFACPRPTANTAGGMPKTLGIRPP